MDSTIIVALVSFAGTVIGTIGGMAFIMFLGLLFTSLVMDIITFVTNYVSEIVYRL